MKRSKETLEFTPELGERLQSLRLRAKVTLLEMVVLIGRQGKGNHRLAGMLERGYRGRFSAKPSVKSGVSGGQR
jgi:hypothetical protein